MTFFLSLFGDTTGAANLDGNFLARCVADKFSGSLFDVTGGARRFVESTALLLSLTVANLLQRLVALLDSLRVGLLLEGDLTLLLKVLLADFLLSGFECRDVGVVALFLLFVNTLKDRVLGNGLNGGFLGDTELSILAPGSLAEIDTSRDGTAV